MLYGKLRPYLNNVAVPDFDGVCSTDILVFQQNSFISNTFLKYCLLKPDFVGFANSTISGVHHPRTSHKKLSVYPIPLPPLSEQRRIVSKIESIFARIDATHEKMASLQDRMQSGHASLASLKSSILKLAFEGKLVPQDPNDEPAELLLKRINNDSDKKLVFEKDNLPNGWCHLPLSHIAEINPKPQNQISNDLEVSFIPMRCVTEQSGQMDLSNVRNYGLVKKGYTYFQNEDILFAKITPCMENGKIAIANNLKNNVGFGSTEFHVIRLKHSQISNKFYFWYLMQESFRHEAKRRMTGTAGQLRVPTNHMKDIQVPLPPLNEQRRIVSRLESIFSGIDAKQKEIEKLDMQLKSIPDSINELKGSILKLAFEGKLVPQDPNDEPASILLERTQSQKTKKT